MEETGMRATEWQFRDHDNDPAIFELKILWPVLWYQGDCQIINLRQHCKRVSDGIQHVWRFLIELPSHMVVNDVQHMYPGSVFNTSDLYILPSKKSARSPSDLRRNLLSARQMWTREWIWWSKPAERVVNITYCHDSWVWQGIHEDIVERRLLHGKNEELILVADDTVQGCTSFSCFGPIVSTWHAYPRFSGSWEQLHHLAPSSRLILFELGDNISANQSLSAGETLTSAYWMRKLQGVASRFGIQCANDILFCIAE